MTGIQLEIAGGKTRFHPGDMLEGEVIWDLPGAPGSVAVRLSWRTRGKGTEDGEVVEQLRIEGAAARDRKPFRMRLPAGPYSFSGKLVSLIWSLEANASAGVKSRVITLTISPTGEEILLHKK